jgi:uncharacterized SAM-binding protein YcdF (DUF218 family)
MNHFLFGYIALVLLVILSIGWFGYRFYNEKRTLFVGVECLIMLLSTTALVVVTASQFEQFAIVRAFLLFIGVCLFVLLVFTALFLPILSICFLIFSGIQLNRKEGWSFSHALSLLVGIAYLGYMIFWPVFNEWMYNDVFSILYSLISFVFVFTFILFILYSFSSLINLLKVPGRTYDFIVVLGNGLIRGEAVSKLLAGRIEKGIELLQQYPESRLIFSGGQGKDEKLPEAVAMKKYAIERGIPGEELLVEMESKNTQENILFSKRLIDKLSENDYPNILLVSNRYHIFRALLTAKDLEIQCDGRGSKTKLYFALNAFIREFIAYLYYWKKRYIWGIGLGCCLILFFHIISWFVL